MNNEFFLMVVGVTIMNWNASIVLLAFIAAGSFLGSIFYSESNNEDIDSYLPSADDAVIHRYKNDYGKVDKGKKNFYNYSGTREGALEQIATGQTFPGLDEDSMFVRELKSKPVSKVYSEYGYVPPNVLKNNGEIKGKVILKRPDGKTVQGLVVDYKGQLYDADIGFPCFLCADSMKELGIKIPYL